LCPDLDYVKYLLDKQAAGSVDSGYGSLGSAVAPETIKVTDGESEGSDNTLNLIDGALKVIRGGYWCTDPTRLPTHTADERVWKAWALSQPCAPGPNLSDPDNPIGQADLDRIDRVCESALSALEEVRDPLSFFCDSLVHSDETGRDAAIDLIKQAMKDTLDRLGVSPISLEGASGAGRYGTGLWHIDQTRAVGGQWLRYDDPAAAIDSVKLSLKALQALSRDREPDYALDATWSGEMDGRQCSLLKRILEARAIVHDIERGGMEGDGAGGRSTGGPALERSMTSNREEDKDILAGIGGGSELGPMVGTADHLYNDFMGFQPPPTS
jgi:hypothetical protein